VAALLHGLAIAGAFPCEVSEHGCHKAAWEGWAFLVAYAGAVVLALALWLDVRRSRGPIAWIRRRRRRKKEERLF